MKSETQVTCPVCGTKINIEPQQSANFWQVCNGNVVNGTLTATVELDEPNAASTIPNTHKLSASDKIKALATAGVNVDNLFSMSGITGNEVIGRLCNGKLHIVPDNDPIFDAIIKSNVIPNRRLFRRWVMSQMFHMLNYRGAFNRYGFTEALNAKGFKYSWKMMLEEYRVQVKLANNDLENFQARNRWFNINTFTSAARAYITELHTKINKLPERHCKGIPYIRLQSRNYFKSDVDEKIFKPLESLVRKAETVRTSEQLYYVVSAFYNRMKRIYFKNDLSISLAFKDAYKGAGAYFTMKNLILFHGATFKNGCVKLNQAKSIALLETRAEQYANEGWRVFGLMKRLITDNDIDIVKKMDEWKKK